jgi:type IV pilus assembly protein PilO
MAPFNIITDRFTQLPQWQKALSVAVGILVLGLILGYLFLFPLWQETKTLKEDVEREQMKLVQIQQARMQINRFKQELSEMGILYNQIRIMMPEAKEIPGLLKNASNLGQQQGLEFLLFKPEKEIPKDFIAEVPVTLHVKGYFHQIGVFFDYIRRLPRIINVKQLELGAFEEKSGKINSRCQLVTFRVLPITAPASVVKAKAPNPKVEKKK